MTFLEFVAEKLLGPPARRTAERSWWVCPLHADSHPSFCTLPPHPKYKDRWTCFGCGARGDEADLLRLLIPGELWPRRRVRLEEWREEYEQLAAAKLERNADRAATGVVAILLRGGGSTRTEDDPRAVALAWADLTDELRERGHDEDTALEILGIVQTCCGQAGVTAEALTAYWQQFIQDRWTVERRHRARCHDPECEARICRRARGLPPLTAAEIEAGRKAS